MLKKLIYLVFILLSTHLHGQTRQTKKVEIPKTLNLKAAYLGSVTHTGFTIGVEFPMYAKEKTITHKSGSVKKKMKERFITANLGMYHHTTFHTNFMLSAEWQMRKTRQSGWFTEFSPGLGFSRTFLDGTTYKQNKSGGFDKVKMAGYNYFMTSIKGGFGYDFNIKKEKPFKTYFKGGLLIFAPYNSFLLPRPTVEFGVIYNLSALKKKGKI
jgi:hypothetical protein